MPKKLLIGAPLALGLVVGLGVGLVTDAQVAESSTTMMIGTRPASDLPNERIDLMTDLTTALTLAPVLQPVADDHGSSVSDLRARLQVQQVGSSSFVNVTYSSNQSDVERQDVLTEVVNSAQDFLTVPALDANLDEAKRNLKLATDAVFGAVRTNGGVNPTQELARQQARLDVLRASGATAEVTALQARMPQIVNSARAFELLVEERDRARTVADSLAEQKANRESGGAQALTTTILDPDQMATPLTQSPPLRRGLAAGLATALLVAGFVLAMAWGRRRNQGPSEPDGHGGGPDDDASPDDVEAVKAALKAELLAQLKAEAMASTATQQAKAAKAAQAALAQQKTPALAAVGTYSDEDDIDDRDDRADLGDLDAVEEVEVVPARAGAGRGGKRPRVIFPGDEGPVPAATSKPSRRG